MLYIHKVCHKPKDLFPSSGVFPMNELISNILRGGVSTVMNIILLFILTKSRFGRKSTLIIISIFLLNIVSTLWFYMYGDLTSLSRFNLVVFIIVGISLKPFTKQGIMQWSFTFLTVINISMMIIVLSFYLGRLFPMPQYANTIFRVILYILVILLFQRHLLSLYQSIVDNWPMFSILVISIFLNLSYYFYVTDNIIDTLITFKWPLLLLVTLSLAAYGTIFYSMKRFTTMYALETENLEIQKETGRLHQVAIQLEKYANYDTLTGLPNRRFFFEKLESIVAESERKASKFVLFYIDLDGFKEINDTHGHEVGDLVLITVGNRLLKGVRKTDFVARLGGDEFAVIIHNVEDMLVAEDLAKKIHLMLQEDVLTDTVQCKINASIGIALYPDTSTDGETLIKNADSAMYEVKRKGKSGVGIFMNQPK